MGGPKQLTDIDQFTGEARDAEQALDDAGLRPITEVVFFQSEELTIDDPEFQAAVNDVTERVAQIQYVENVRSPLDGEGDVTDDGHTALVNFDVAGESTEVGERVDPALAAVAAVQADYPDMTIEEFGGASAEEAIDEVIQGDLGKAGMLSLPVTLIILTLTFGTLVAAGVPLLIGLTSVLAAMGLIAILSQISPVDGNVNAVILLIGLAVGVDYSLFYLRREREERAAGRSEGAALAAAAATSGPGRADLRIDRDRGHGGHVHQRRQGVHLLRRRNDPGRGNRDVRVAHRACRRCCRGSGTGSRRAGCSDATGAPPASRVSGPRSLSA